MNISKNLKSYALSGMIGVAAGLWGSHVFGKACGIDKTVLEDLTEQTTKLYENAQDRIETERAIRAEGIQAQSYAEAKMKLDSVNFDKVCKEIGVSVPQKPAINASSKEQTDYTLQVLDIYKKSNKKHYNEILQKIQTLKNS